MVLYQDLLTPPSEYFNNINENNATIYIATTSPHYTVIPGASTLCFIYLLMPGGPELTLKDGFNYINIITCHFQPFHTLLGRGVEQMSSANWPLISLPPTLPIRGMTVCSVKPGINITIYSYSRYSSQDNNYIFYTSRLIKHKILNYHLSGILR